MLKNPINVVNYSNETIIFIECLLTDFVADADNSFLFRLVFSKVLFGSLIYKCRIELFISDSIVLRLLNI